MPDRVRIIAGAINTYLARTPSQVDAHALSQWIDDHLTPQRCTCTGRSACSECPKRSTTSGSIVWCSRAAYHVKEDRLRILATIQTVTSPSYQPETDSSPVGYIYVTPLDSENQIVLNAEHISSITPLDANR